MGSVLKIEKGYPPSVEIPVVQDYETDLPKLKLFDPYTNDRMKTILEGTRRLKKRFDGEVPVILNVRAPFTHANLMRGPENVFRDIFNEKENFHELLEIALTGCIIYAVAAISAGADIILVGDAMSSGDMISRQQYDEFCCSYTKRLIRMISRSGIRTILHTCGNTEDRLDLMASTGANCLSLDEAVDLEKARKILGPDCCLMGNLNTTLLAMGSPEEVEEATKEAIDKAGRDGHLFISGGCLIQNCEAENMRAMIKTAREYHI
jgi:uroporphyrinogen decarboxylase